MKHIACETLEVIEPATRAKILAAARYLAMRDGMAGFSMEAVALRSGLSRRTVYNQFESREILYRGAIQHIMDEMEERIEFDLPVAMPVVVAVRQFCMSVLGVMISDEYREIVATIERDGREAPWLGRLLDRRILNPIRSRIQLYLFNKMIDGALGATDPGEFSASLLATLEASAEGLRGSGAIPFTIEEVIDVIVRRLPPASLHRTDAVLVRRSEQG